MRSLADRTKSAPILALGSVDLREADVRNEQQMRSALDGIDTLFHAAAVYSLTERHRQAEILESAIRGTEVALSAAAAAGVRHVVMTSSVVTLPLTARGAPPATEQDWASDLRVPYVRAKTESERRAWQLSKELKLPLAAVLPAGIIGPGFARNTPTIDIVQASLMGVFRLGAPDGNFSFVDARDTAEAHVLAAERGAVGRFIVGYEHAPTFDQLVRTLSTIVPSVRPPLMILPAFVAPFLPLYDLFSNMVRGTPRIATPEVIASAVSGRFWNFSTGRAKSQLGWSPRFTFEESLRATVDLLREPRPA